MARSPADSIGCALSALSWWRHEPDVLAAMESQDRRDPDTSAAAGPRGSGSGRLDRRRRSSFGHETGDAQEPPHPDPRSARRAIDDPVRLRGHAQRAADMNVVVAIVAFAALLALFVL